MLILNWKMNLSCDKELTLFNQILKLDTGKLKLAVAPSFLTIREIGSLLRQNDNYTNIFLAGQDCSQEMSGNFTGQISAQNLKNSGCSYCIVGHYESRAWQHLSDQQVLKKTHNCLKTDLIPIVCVGAKVKGYSEMEKLVNTYLRAINPIQPKTLIFAYEPARAIGTKKTESISLIETMAEIIKTQAGRHPWKTKVVYGGSVNSKNIISLNKVKILDGFLIGNSGTDFQEVKKMVDLLRPGRMDLR